MKTKSDSGVIRIAENRYGFICRGMPVIINETDQPCAKLVAVVTTLVRLPDNGVRVCARYLSIEHSGKYSSCHGRLANVTPLVSFRRTLLLTAGGEYECVEFDFAIRDCCSPISSEVVPATYAKDGGLRKWQEWGCPTRTARKEVLAVLKYNCQLSMTPSRRISPVI